MHLRVLEQIHILPAVCKEMCGKIISRFYRSKLQSSLNGGTSKHVCVQRNLCTDVEHISVHTACLYCNVNITEQPALCLFTIVNNIRIYYSSHDGIAQSLGISKIADL